jgi:hypothetical protein
MLKLPTLAAVSCAILVAGCTAQTASLRTDAGQPADPRAPEAPAPLLVGLAPDAFDRAIADEPRTSRADSTIPAPADGHAIPSRHQGHGQGPGGAATGAPAAPDSTSTRSGAPGSETYVCPMHRDVTDVKASECPRCGMTLVRRGEKP